MISMIGKIIIFRMKTTGKKRSKIRKIGVSVELLISTPIFEYNGYNFDRVCQKNLYRMSAC